MADLVNTTGGITRLNTHNYQSWRSRIKSYLEGQDLWEVVNGNDTKQPENAEKLHKWKVKAAKAMYVLKSTIEDWLLGRIRDDDTPKMTWDTFESLFLEKNNARLQYGVGDTDFTPVEVDMRMMRMDPELYKAAQQGDVEYLETEILQRDRTEEVDSQDHRSDEFFLRRTQHGNNNILHVAARAGRDNFVKEALHHFPVLSDQVNSQGDTPLLVAARFGHLQVVKKLVAATVENITNSSQRDLEQGLADGQLDVQRINSKQGTTAIHEALRNGHQDVARYLLKEDPEKATFESHAGESPLFLAAESLCQDFVEDILRSGRLYSTKGPHGQNALHAAQKCAPHGQNALNAARKRAGRIIFKKNPELMRQLDYSGKAAIHYAIEPEYRVLFDQMLNADPSIALFRDADGYTPLLRAASRGYLKICQAILQKCPESVEARNYQGQNALHLFKLWNKRDWEELFKIPEILELLNIVDDEGNTPLHLALLENNKGKAIFLIGRQGIHLGAVNKQGHTALDLCKSKWKQGSTFVLLAIQGAPKGRLPKNEEVPVRGRDLKPFINTMTLVATLLATITFAAAFTMPGGFDTNPDNLGVAILIKKVSLKAFILADTIAMCCSMTVMFLLMWAMIAQEDQAEELANVSSMLLPFALFATLVAFVCAIFAVIAPKALWLTILVGIICSCLIVSSSPVYLSLATIHLWVFEASAVLIRKYVEARKKRGNGNNSDHQHEEDEDSGGHAVHLSAFGLCFGQLGYVRHFFFNSSLILNFFTQTNPSRLKLKPTAERCTTPCTK